MYLPPSRTTAPNFFPGSCMIQLPEHCSKGCDILGNGGNRKIFKSTQSDSLLSTIATAPKTGVDDLLPSGDTAVTVHDRMNPTFRSFLTCSESNTNCARMVSTKTVMLRYRLRKD